MKRFLVVLLAITVVFGMSGVSASATVSPSALALDNQLASIAVNGVPYESGGAPELNKEVISPDDFSFVGAFRPPGGRLNWYTGLTLRYVDGNLKLYTLQGPYAYKPPGGHLLEFDVPDTLSQTVPYVRQINSVSFGDIYQDKITKTSGEYTLENPGVGLMGGTEVPDGIYWDEQDQRMYWTKVTFYDTSLRRDTGIGFSTLDDETKTGTGVGNWIINTDAAPGKGLRWTHSMTAIPQWFADTYLGGRRLGVGFGGGESIVSNGASLGPTLFAVAPPNPENEPHMSVMKTPAIDLMSHIFGTESQARRNPGLSRYFSGDSGDVYEWGVYGAACPNGVWVEGETKHGVIAFATLACGNANTSVVRTISPTAIEVGDPGDIIPGDQIFINTNWLNPAAKTYQNEPADVASVDGNIITLTAPLKGEPVIDDYTAKVTYPDGDKYTIKYTNKVVCGTIYYGGGPKSSRDFNAWYIYDPADLAASAKGETAPDAVEPVFNGRVDYQNITYPVGGSKETVLVKGAAFDKRTNRLYLLLRGKDVGDNLNGAVGEAIYVYQLNDEPVKSTGPAIEQPTGPAIEQPTGPAIEQPTGPAIEQPTGPAIDTPSGGDNGGDGKGNSGNGNGSGDKDNSKVAVGVDGVPVLSAEPSETKPLDFGELPASAFKIANKTWTGKRIRYVTSVKLTYRLNGKTVTKTLRFRADYSTSNIGKNKNIGKGSITIKGQTGSKYKGSKALTFKIVPKKPTKLKVTAGKKSLTVKWKKVSKAQKATGYQIQYRYKTGKKWSAWKTKTFKISYKTKAKTVLKTIKKSKAKKQYQIRIRTYKTIKSGASKGRYYSAWA